MLFHKLFSTTLGIGYIGKGGGTVAAIACCICWYAAWKGHTPPPLLFSVILTVIITLVGVWSSGIVATIWGKDPSRVVIDEVAGMCVSLLCIPVELKYVVTGLILFRFFDIAKPLFIRRMERLPGGTGIMMDDVLAGIYTNVLLCTVVWFKIY